MSRLIPVVNDGNRWMMRERFGANVYTNVSSHRANDPKLNLSRGWNLRDDRVTFKFNWDAKKTRSQTAANRFEIKLQGVRKSVFCLTSRAHDDFIMKQAEAINTFYDSKLVAQLEELVSLRDATQKQVNALSAKYHNLKDYGGAETEVKDAKKEMKEQTALLNTTNKSIEGKYEKMVQTYINFMGEFHGPFTDAVENNLTRPTLHKEVVHDLVKGAFQWDSTKNETIGRMEHLDDKADDPTFNDPDIVFRWVVKEVEKEINAPRGLSFEGIMHAIRMHSVNHGGFGRAEIQKKNMANHGLFQLKDAFPVKDFAGFLEDMNRNIPLLSSTKDNPLYTNNDKVEWGNIPFTQHELCDILLDSMPKKVQQLFKSHNATGTLRFDVQNLATELQPLCDQVWNEQKKNKNNPPQAGGGKGGAGKGSGNRNGKAGKQGQGKGNAGDGERKHCKLCKRFGGAFNNHNTEECNKYNDDGSNKRKQSRNNYNTEMMQMLTELKKDVNHIKKKKKRSESYSDGEESE